MTKPWTLLVLAALMQSAFAAEPANNQPPCDPVLVPGALGGPPLRALNGYYLYHFDRAVDDLRNMDALLAIDKCRDITALLERRYKRRAFIEENIRNAPPEYQKQFDQVLNTPNLAFFMGGARRFQEQSVEDLVKLGLSDREACAVVWGQTSSSLNDYMLTFSRRMQELASCDRTPVPR